MDSILAVVSVWGALSVLFAGAHWRWVYYAPAAAEPRLVSMHLRVLALPVAPN
ncbi:MAG TPA: hypothetical protein VEH62_14620 [Gemmatimonadales bacterium]|nr:hypothetical protein [Gemmatimonadales bacterium]